MRGVVYLIGAGPGDPGLLTLRGAEALQRCDVVLYDGLSNAQLLRHAPAAEHICVGKHGQSRIWTQQEIVAEMLRFANAGKTVGRLKGGDPAVFARTAEEIDALEQAQIPFEIVPGITAALAAGSYAGIPITHRKLASAVALVTGHEEPGKPDSAIDWRALADFPGTLVIYMGVTTAKTWTAELIQAGKDPATPTALIRRCSHRDQETIRCRLDAVPVRMEERSLRPPVIAILGEVANLGAGHTSRISQAATTALGASTSRTSTPLAGKTILVTRPRGQAESLIRAIESLGGQAVVAPAIAIEPVQDYGELDAAINQLDAIDLLIFCSANGVEHFFARLRQLEQDARSLAGAEVAVVGKKTAEALSRFGIRADHVPEDFRASSLAESLSPTLKGKRVLIVRASRGSDELPRTLLAAEAEVTKVIAYHNVDVAEPDREVARQLAAGELDWITVTSSATAVNLKRLYGDALKQARIAAISPVTASTLQELDLQADAIADPHTTADLLEAIVKQS